MHYPPLCSACTPPAKGSSRHRSGLVAHYPITYPFEIQYAAVRCPLHCSFALKDWRASASGCEQGDVNIPGGTLQRAEFNWTHAKAAQTAC